MRCAQGNMILGRSRKTRLRHFEQQCKIPGRQQRCGFLCCPAFEVVCIITTQAEYQLNNQKINRLLLKKKVCIALCEQHSVCANQIGCSMGEMEGPCGAVYKPKAQTDNADLGSQ